jgi:hypothetical protein
MLGSLLALLWLLGVPVASGLTTIVVDNITLGEKYHHFVNSSVEIIFIFSNATQVYTHIKLQCIVLCIKLYALLFQVGAHTPARVSVQSDEASDISPVLVVARHQRGVLSWQLPYETERQEYFVLHF